jgi:protein TonB
MVAMTINSFPSIHSWRSPRAWALAIIVLLHLGFFWALSSGLTPAMLKSLITAPPVLLPMPEAQRKPPERVIKEPIIDQQPQFTVAHKVIDFPLDPVDNVGPYVPPPTAPNDFREAGDVVAPPAPVVIEPRIDARRGLSEPFYPPQVIREGGEGTVTLSIYILADGRVGEVKLDQSSGHPRLDDSAMREAKRWRFVPGTSDGKPVAMWKKVPVTFRLNTRM